MRKWNNADDKKAAYLAVLKKDEPPFRGRHILATMA